MSGRIANVIKIFSAVFFAVALIGGLFAIVIAQETPTGSISGIVVHRDKEVFKGNVANAKIIISGGNVLKRTFTDEEGRFKVTDIPTGEYWIRATARYLANENDVSVKVFEGQASAAGPVVMATRKPDIDAFLIRTTYSQNDKVGLTIRGYSRDNTAADIELFAFDARSYLKNSYLHNGTPFDYTNKTPIKKWSAELKKDADGFFEQDVKLPSDKLGQYLVRTTMGNISRYSWFIISDLGLVVKQSKSKTLAYCVDFKTGKPVESADLAMYAYGSRVWESKTDTDGLYLHIDSSDTDNAVVFAEKDGSFASSNAGYWADGASNVCYIYTDRPVYRPGDTVYYKGIIRAKWNNFYKNLPDTDIPVIVKDANGRKIVDTVLKTNDFGTFNGEFEISEKASLGAFEITAKIFDRKLNEYREYQIYPQVAEYRKPEYTVTLDFDKDYFVAGTPIKATVSASYYFGAPVENADVSYTVFKSRAYYYGTGFDDFYSELEDAYSGAEYGYGEYLMEGTGKTDAEGKLKISIPTDKDPQGDATYQIEITATDQSLRSISASGETFVPEGMYRISAATEDMISRPGENVDIIIKAADHDDKPMPNASVSVWIDEVIWVEHSVQYKQSVEKTAVTGVDGKSIIQFSPKKEGNYRIRLESKDSSGNTIHGFGDLWVAGDNYSGYGYQAASLEIVRDKKVYQVGDMAEVIINSSVNNVYALLTVEGSDLHYNELIYLKGNSTLVKLRAKAEYVPNAFISVCLVDKMSFISNEISFNVSPKFKFLNVSIKSDKEVYKPGDIAKYSIKTTNSSGEAVSAEVSMGIVDESIYAIMEDRTPDIKKSFYGTKYNNVNTSYSFAEYYLGGSDKDGSGSNVRKYFPDTAYWSPTFKTDESGMAYFSLKMPDSLTTWRATARAITADTSVGWSTYKVRSVKDLIVRLQTPRFITQNDTLAISGVLHNYTDKAQKVKLRLKIEGLELDEKTNMSVLIGKGEINRYEWSVSAVKAGSARITIYADGETASDAMETSLQVLPHGIEKIKTANGSVDKESTSSFEVPENIIPETLRMEVRMAPSAAGIMLGSLKYLADYPYGCVEQTLSRFLPTVIAAETMKKIGKRDPELEKVLSKMVDAGLESLRNFQRSDGGWGWWEDESSPYTSAYVVYGLTHAARAGYPVDQEMLQKGIDSLKSQLDRIYAASLQKTPDKAPFADPTQMAYMLYALSLNGVNDHNKLIDMYNKREKMTVYGRSLLALALYESGNRTQANKMTDEIIKRSDLFKGMRSWKAAEGWGWENSSLEASAYALRAMIRRDPADPRAEEVVRWLCMKRYGGRWESTKDTAAIVYALGEYISANSEKFDIDYTADILVNGKHLKSVKLSQNNLYTQETIVSIPSDMLNSGSNKITIRKKGKGSLYFSTVLRYFNLEENIKAYESGIKVKREYFRLEPIKSANGTSTLRPIPLGSNVRIGEKVLCRLTLDCRNEYHYVVIEDPRPAGWESIEQLSDDSMYGDYSPDGWVPWTKFEFRDEKTAIFATRLPQGKWVAEYYMRAEVPGQFHSLPALAYAMYAPQLNGNGAEQRISIK